MSISTQEDTAGARFRILVSDPVAPDAVQSLRRGEWKRSQFVGVEVYNKVLGVIGFGKIGREVARRCRGLGMRVLASDAYVSEEQARREGAEMVELPDLYSRSDYIS